MNRIAIAILDAARRSGLALDLRAAEAAAADPETVGETAWKVRAAAVALGDPRLVRPLVDLCDAATCVVYELRAQLRDATHPDTDAGDIVRLQAHAERRIAEVERLCAAFRPVARRVSA